MDVNPDERAFFGLFRNYCKLVLLAKIFLELGVLTFNGMDLYNTNGRVVLNITEAKATGFIFNTLWLRGAGRSIIGGGGAYSYIRVHRL